MNFLFVCCYTFSCLSSSSCERKYISQTLHFNTSQPCPKIVSSSTSSLKHGRCMATASLDVLDDCWSVIFGRRVVAWTVRRCRDKFPARPNFLSHCSQENILTCWFRPLSSTNWAQVSRPFNRTLFTAPERVTWHTIRYDPLKSTVPLFLTDRKPARLFLGSNKVSVSVAR